MDINLLGGIWKESWGVEDKNTSARIAYPEGKPLLYLLDLHSLTLRINMWNEAWNKKRMQNDLQELNEK